MNANLEQIKQEIIAGAEELNSSKEVYEFKKKFLDGKTGKIGLLMKEMKNIPNDQKAEYGKGVNELKVWAQEFLGGLDEKMKAQRGQLTYSKPHSHFGGRPKTRRLLTPRLVFSAPGAPSRKSWTCPFWLLP